MRYEYRAVFRLDKKIVISFLKKHNINYEKDELTKLCVLYYYNDDPLFTKIQKIIDKHHVFYQVSTIYSAQEMNDADWFNVRSVWLNDYPYPKDEYERLVYGIENKTQCLCNKKQVGNFAIVMERW